MKVLINGVFLGGNCPPFYANLKKCGNNVKIIDATHFNSPYRNFSTLIGEDDIIIPKYSKLDVFFFKLYSRSGLNFLLFSIRRKLNKEIAKFSPDIIINHQMSIRANVMMSTQFSPQLGFIYGSEIKGDNIHRPNFAKTVQYHAQILTTTDEARLAIEKAYPEARAKLNTILCPTIDINALLKRPANTDIDAIRSSLGFGPQDFILFDNRSLRSKAVLSEALKAYHTAILANPLIKVILIKGFSGSEELVIYANEFAAGHNCSSNIKTINHALTEDEHYDLLIASDTVTSLLTADQFGEVILQGMVFRKRLLLYDLPQYHAIIGENAYYTDGSATSISAQIERMYQAKDDRSLDQNKDNVISNLNPEIAFKKINALLKNMVNEIH